MTESESVALPLGDTPINIFEKHYSTGYGKKQAVLRRFVKIEKFPFFLNYIMHCNEKPRPNGRGKVLLLFYNKFILIRVAHRNRPDTATTALRFTVLGVYVAE